MKSIPSCPECGKVLSAPAKRCRCGWMPSVKSKTPTSDGRCEYLIGGRRCPLPGTMCPYPYGHGPWYCSGHWHCLDDPRLGEAALRHAEENYHAILAERCDWRDVMLGERIQKDCRKKVLRSLSHCETQPTENGDENTAHTETEKK